MSKRSLIVAVCAVAGAPPLLWALLKLWRAARASSAFDFALGLVVLVGWIWFALAIGRALARHDAT